jgi:hypothetical protein
MFGFRGGESPDTVARKKAYMREAQDEWVFLTNYDLSTIKTEGQLISMVKDRTGRPEPEARKNVQAWMQGKTF